MPRAWPTLALLSALALGSAACSRGEAAAPAPPAARPATAAPAQPAPLAAPHAQAPAHAPAAASPAAGGQPSAALPRLIFFMNPSGRPCQIQDQVLHEMAGQLSGRVELVYARTTEPGDIAAFQHYGIRALPTLLVADASGREIRRAPPGIQSASQILQLVAP